MSVILVVSPVTKYYLIVGNEYIGCYKDNIIGLQSMLRLKALSCLHKLQTYNVGQ